MADTSLLVTKIAFVVADITFKGITVNLPQNQLAHPTNSPHYQLAPTNSPHLFYQLAPLLLPTRPMLFVNSPQFSDQLAPTFTNSPHMSYQLATLLLPTRPTFLPTRPTMLAGPMTTLTRIFVIKWSHFSCEFATL